MPSSQYATELGRAADAACDRCFELASMELRTLRGGRRAFYPIVRPDQGRFGVGIVDDYHYLVYQDTGFATFVMTSLAGKVVPMLVNGQRIFRYARPSAINKYRSGRRVYWRRDADGNLMGVNEQRRSWVHPGLPPKNFVSRGVNEVAHERANDIYRALLADMGL